MINIIRDKDCLVLDVNTDSVSFISRKNTLPFELEDDGINIKGYYFDDAQIVHKYKLEEKVRSHVQRLKGYKRTDTYKYKAKEWSIISDDPTTNDFTPLIKQILDSNKSINIDGLAGCGKSTFINQVQTEMTNRGIKFISLAPTNKAARVIKGQTIHKFIISNTKKTLKDNKMQYIFIDEISMVHEIFYKYFIVLKRMRPDLKFIIAGDFNQLEPVNDRVKNCDYMNSTALYELSDGQRLQLSKCRRADDSYFKLIHPSNIPNLKPTDFVIQSNTCKFLNHITFTNKKRIEMNAMMIKHFIVNIKKVNLKSQLKLNKLAYDPNSQDVILYKDMPLIARKGDETKSICNNDLFTIKKICDKIIIVTDGILSEILILILIIFNVYFTSLLLLQHINHKVKHLIPYLINEWSRYSSKMKYAALSRSTSKELVNFTF